MLLWTKHNRMKKHKGIIFDYDGTVMDTQTPVHANAEAQVLSRYGVIVTPESISKRFAGIPTVKVFETLAPEENPEQLVAEKWELVRTIISTERIRPISGMHNLFEHIYQLKLPMIIATASPRWYIEAMMSKSLAQDGAPDALLEKYFGKNYVSAEEVAKPKPGPDVFLKAAEIIGIPARECLVVGDGCSDVMGATSAGMDVVYLSNSTKAFASMKNVSVFTDGAHIYEYLKRILN